MYLPYWRVCPISLLRFTTVFLYCSASESSRTAEPLLAQGTLYLTDRKPNQALDLYSQAIEVDPNNYMAYYKRAIAYIAIGKLRHALPDIDKSVQLNPGFALARKERAKIHLKLGNLKDAEKSLQTLNSDDEDKNKLLNDISDMKINVEQARTFYSSGRYSEALPLLDYVMKVITFDSELHEMRALCNIKMGDTVKGIEELRDSVHMLADNRAGILRVSKLMYDAGLAARSLEEVRSCLRLDHEDASCLAHHRKIKVLAKAITDAQDSSESEKWSECLSHAQRILQLEGTHPEYELQGKKLVCRCGARADPKISLETCDYVISRISQFVDPHLDKAEAYVNLEMYDEAEAEYRQVLELEKNNQQAAKGIKTVRNLKSRGKKRDYYKILGVSRTAKDAEIRRAYRKKAAEAHPDKFTDEKEKKAAENSFRDINDARDVLLDKKLRELFDRGEDPKDPEAQNRGPFGSSRGYQFSSDSGPFGFNFFQFNPFQDMGGGHYEFHFG